MFNNYIITNKKKFTYGFTLIELIISMGIFVIIMSFSGITYINIQKNSDLINQTTQLVSSIKQAQNMSISGQTADSLTNIPAGIHLAENEYSIFVGTTYIPDNANNVTVNLPNSIMLDINLPTNDILFEIHTGEISGFDSDYNTIIINHQNGQSKTIQINKLGVVNY